MRMRIALTLAAMLVTTTAQAANQVSTGRVRTVRPIVINLTRDLDFGSLIIATTAGRATVNPRTDVRTRTGGVTLAPGGTPGAARFVVSGTPSRPVQVTLGTRPTLTRSGGTETMTMTAMTMNGGINRTLTAAGTLDLRVGGTLAVAANQVAGVYAGTFTVTVDYR
jgi:spore coat protein U-like protein